MAAPFLGAEDLSTAVPPGGWPGGLRHLGPVVGWPRTSRRPAPKCRSPRVPRRPVPVGGVVVVLTSGVGTTQFRKGAVADWDCGLLGSTPPPKRPCVCSGGADTPVPDPQGRFGCGVGFWFFPRPSRPVAWLARPRRGNRWGPYTVHSSFGGYPFPSVEVVEVSPGALLGLAVPVPSLFYSVAVASLWCPDSGAGRCAIAP